ncbi:sodium/potassium-transporting ATPase subunit beta-1-like [Haliotis asinina]|uniref:sodium/potassium-transporting ATPase subunit beta-1-like n=1 Tax=Haliotis asinina TaxID=109174 RepID=UPI003531F364
MASLRSGVSGYTGYSESQSQWTAHTLMSQSMLPAPTAEDRLNDFKKFCYNPDDGTVMGFTAVHWVFRFLFYLAFYVALGLFFAANMGIFFVILDWNFPTMQGVDSLLKVPGLGFRPMPDSMSTVIRFVKGDASTYTQYLDHLEAYLRYYENENQQGENYKDCSEIRERRTTELDKVCRFDILQLGADCVKQQNFGFDDGQPCILLKLNKIFNWEPEEFTNETVPDEIRDTWSQWSITVTCDGENPVDRESMGPLSYHPPNGFHFKYFPFRNQQGYRSPLMFVRFEEPRPGVLLMITCKAWARNIYHNRNEMVGQVHFELLVD